MAVSDPFERLSKRQRASTPLAFARYLSLCGKKVYAELYDSFGFRREGGPTNVRPVGHEEARPVTCKRCLSLLA